MGALALQQVLAVGAGGFLGAVLRYAAFVGVARLAPASTFPAGTLVVNVAGCLAIGFLGGWSEARELCGPLTRLFLFVGVLGGFTTYSAFAWDTLVLWRADALARAALYVGAHVALGLFAAGAGFAVARRLAS